MHIESLQLCLLAAVRGVAAENSRGIWFFVLRKQAVRTNHMLKKKKLIVICRFTK
jgi:hypothetical protein